MTSLEPRNPETDELLSPENSMFLLIDYQPTQVNSINSMNKQDLINLPMVRSCISPSCLL